MSVSYLICVLTDMCIDDIAVCVCFICYRKETIVIEYRSSYNTVAIHVSVSSLVCVGEREEGRG